ncbi:MAG: endolytic transglycosylase MltG [Chloroflexota bacterium]
MRVPPPRRALPGHRRSGPVTVALLLIVVILFGAAFVAVRKTLNRGIPLSAVASGPSLAPGTAVLVTIKPGETSRQIGQDLQAKGLVPSELVFLGVVKLRGVGAAFQPGQYKVVAGTPVEQIVTELQQPPPLREIRVTFPEGWRLEQDSEVAGKQGIGTASAFVQLAQHPNASWKYSFLADHPKSASLEGYLFPDTYLVSANSPKPADLIKRMLDNFDRRVTPALRKRIAAQKHTLFDTLIIASIVEREAKVPSERPLIAGVYWNRFNSHQGLFADPTVQYALGKPGDWWPKLNAPPATLSPTSPYNTYTHGGLPPGPICNPGLPSIEAAANPQGNYLYFVAKNDGSGQHAFARTLAGQNANEAKYSH